MTSSIRQFLDNDAICPYFLHNFTAIAKGFMTRDVAVVPPGQLNFVGVYKSYPKLSKCRSLCLSPFPAIADDMLL